MVTIDFTADQGSTLNRTITLTQQSGTPYNLSGYDARLQIRRTYGATSPLVNCTLMNGKLVLGDAVNGVIQWELVPSDTSSIRFNAIDDSTLDTVYALEITAPDGTTTSPVGGTLTLTREVTR